MAHSVPAGFQLTGVHCGIKKNPQKEDLALIVCPQPAVAAGVYTQNLIVAAPVVLDRQRTPSDRCRVVVVNSGNANACTGERGMRDALEMSHLAAQACDVDDDQSLVMSTGVIGVHMPMDKIAAGISAAAGRLDADEASLVAAARGIMTTDQDYKLASRTVQLAGQPVQVTGMAKGAGMIGPNMATMLAVVMTDAALRPGDAQQTLQQIADQTFNCISVEGHTSTNDSLLLLASGAAGGKPLAGEDLAALSETLREVCTELARMIPADGEGASHLITIEVSGGASREDARLVAKSLANSLLVKTAVAGGDPNWGRIVSAAGYAGVAFDPAQVDLIVNGILLYQRGSPVAFDEAATSRSIRQQHETIIQLRVGDGPGSCRFWTSDLNENYVRFNADYRT